MIKKLKVQQDFTPCPAVAEDELFANGIFVFNITKMIEYIKNNLDSVALRKITVDDFCENVTTIDESHIDTVEISQPVILAEISPGRYNLVDGHHRMEKARRMGIKHLQAYKLTVDQHIKFLINKEAYVTYIEYWNSKLK